jgi:hypothetical protein
MCVAKCICLEYSSVTVRYLGSTQVSYVSAKSEVRRCTDEIQVFVGTYSVQVVRIMSYLSFAEIHVMIQFGVEMND